jgi:hypothetical protein
MMFLNTLYCIISHLVIIKLTMPIFINTMVDHKCAQESMKLAKYPGLSHGYHSKKRETND